ncbi:hypothetical protein ACFLZP_01055 [Patescibacteria group bacterium]
MREREKVLLLVHMSSARKWASKGNSEAGELVERVEAAKRAYDRVVEFEYDPWEPDYSPEEAEFTWLGLCIFLGWENQVDVAGVQTGICIKKVRDELFRRNLWVTVLKGLIMDLGNNQ